MAKAKEVVTFHVNKSIAALLPKLVIDNGTFVLLYSNHQNKCSVDLILIKHQHQIIGYMPESAQH